LQLKLHNPSCRPFVHGIISLKLIKTTTGTLTAAVEILKNSPRIARLIEEGNTKDILEEMESSVGLYKMQSMNQSLIALLVHQKISYQDAMALASDKIGQDAMITIIPKAASSAK